MRSPQALGFDRPTANSLDAVSDRDFALEYLGAAAICAVHLSRLAEEIVVWCSDAFRFIRLTDAFTTGSSIMPQKKNPDAAELVRAKSGRVIGSLSGLLIVMKGLPLAYSKDMQEDKEPVFETDDTLGLCIAAMAGMVRDLTPDAARMRAATEAGFITATDLADWLVRVLGLPFRQAHHVTGRIVKLAEDRNAKLAELSLADLQSVEPRITQAVFDVLTVGRLRRQPDQLRRNGAGDGARGGRLGAGAFPVSGTPSPCASRPHSSRPSLWPAAARSPATLEPPQGRAADRFPSVYPNPALDPQPQRQAPAPTQVQPSTP